MRAAVATGGLPEGTFSYLPGPSTDLGSALVADPRIKAVGFTGSRAGGLALMRVAAGRPEPIPVYAEMSAVNPVVLLPGALRARSASLAAGFVQSLTLGAGQFCTNPGLLIGIAGSDLDAFAEAAAAAIRESVPHTMLTPDIRDRFAHAVAALAARPGVTVAARGAAAGPGGAPACLLRTEARHVLADPALADEMFGPAALLVAAADMAEVTRLLESLGGQLTATLHLDRADEHLAAGLVPLLARKAGRILANGWPTGVEVAPAMVHGGPFPATSDGRSSSVGTLAIERFLRPVCYQDLPDALLPPPLRRTIPGISRAGSTAFSTRNPAADRPPRDPRRPRVQDAPKRSSPGGHRWDDHSYNSAPPTGSGASRCSPTVGRGGCSASTACAPWRAGLSRRRGTIWPRRRSGRDSARPSISTRSGSCRPSTTPIPPT